MSKGHRARALAAEILERWMNGWRHSLITAVHSSVPSSLLLHCTLRNGRRFVETRAGAGANRSSRGLRFTWVPSKASCNRSSGSPYQRVGVHLHHAAAFFIIWPSLCSFVQKWGKKQVDCSSLSTDYLMFSKFNKRMNLCKSCIETFFFKKEKNRLKASFLYFGLQLKISPENTKKIKKCEV